MIISSMCFVSIGGYFGGRGGRGGGRGGGGRVQGG